MIAISQIIVGIFQLLLGRRLFWLMVGIAGFLAGISVTISVLDWSPWLKLMVGVGIGIVFAILAVLIQKPMAAIVAFLAFGVAVLFLARLFGIELGHGIFWILFVVGGLIGAILAFTLYDWALIIGTSLLGASSVSAGLNALLNSPGSRLLASVTFLILVAVGIAYQSRSLPPENA